MLQTLLKPWRAHSELDGLSDTECRELIERRWRRDPPPLRAITAAAALAGLAWLPAVFLFAATQTRLREDPGRIMRCGGGEPGCCSDLARRRPRLGMVLSADLGKFHCNRRGFEVLSP